MGFLLLGTDAHAELTFTLTTEGSGGQSVDSLSIGDLVTIDITLRSDGQPIRVLEASATGYDPDILSLRSATTVNSVLSRVCLQSSEGLECYGGIYLREDASLTEVIEPPLAPYVKIFEGQAGFPFSSTGELDYGVHGVESGPQFQLVFRAVSAGITTVEIGIHPELGDIAGGLSPIVSNNASLTITVVPEPGTALLIGFGLAGLAARFSPESPRRLRV